MERKGAGMDVQVKRGILEICVLSVLARGDSYGYQIIKDMNEKVPITESTLYPILKRLESAGFLTVYSVEHQGRLRKFYAITMQGRQKIQDFIENWKDVMDAYQFITEGWNNHDKA